MSETRIIVGPRSATSQVEGRAQALGLQTGLIRYGMLAKGSISEWVGIEPPEGGDDLLVNLVAPDVDGREPSLAWAYTRNGRWSWEPDGASSCFNHTDLVAIRVEVP